MYRSYNFLLIVLLNLILLPAAWAADEDNDCGRLYIQISNASRTSCQLLSKNVVHGKLISSPVAMILPGSSERFDMRQTFYGPEIVLEYLCDSQIVKFVSQQNLCVFKAGKVTGTVLFSDPNIKATHTEEDGSSIWSNPGMINWVLSTN